jgi:hypothetical protein
MSIQLEQVRRFYTVLWNAHDKSAIPTVLKDNVSFRGTQGHKKRGHNGFAEYTDFIHEALGEFQLEWAGCTRFVFDDELISDVWVLGDLEELDAQLEANVGHIV